MTSKNLFFKLMKKDLGQRLWAVALIGMGCFFAYPVTAAVSAGDIERYEDLKLGMIRYSDQILEWLSFENGMTAFVMMVAGPGLRNQRLCLAECKKQGGFLSQHSCAQRGTLCC